MDEYGVLPDPEVARLHRVLEDVRFSLERGYWQTALAAARAALARDEASKAMRCAGDVLPSL